MSLLKERIVYKPFEYPQAYDYWLKQQQAHWLHTEVPMANDVTDWKSNMTANEKNVVGQILKGFAQTETIVNDYWSTLVTKWFRKPEIIMMGTTLGSSETIHAEAYSLLNEQLGLDDFSEFLEDEATMAKIESLMNVRDNHDGTANWHERAKSLAIFSAFTEGVNLFSSFAVLLSYKMRNLLKGVGQIVEWSVRDESLHSNAGCWLFRTLMEEHPEFKTPELVKEIEEAAHLALKLEFDFIDKVFEMGDLENLSKSDLKNFIKHRVNTKMGDLGYGAIVNGIDQDAIKRMKWFDSLSAGKQHTDFFANRVTNYSKGVQNWDVNDLF
jgi:ribonucleoside-diphosphate reductase beta chain